MSKEQDRVFIRNFIGVIAALAVSGVIFGILGNILADVYSNPEQRAEQIARLRAERLQPVGNVRTASEPGLVTTAAATSGGSGDARSGQQVAEQVCSACHTTTFMNAPQMGNKEQWAPRAEKGLDTLVTHVMQGFGNMPAQASVVDKKEARAAVKYMVEEKTGIQLK